MAFKKILTRLDKIERDTPGRWSAGGAALITATVME